MRVLITEMMEEQGIQLLKEIVDVEYIPQLWKDRELLFLKAGAVDALIVRNQTQVNQVLLAQAEQLKVIGRLGVGLDNIDLEACAQREIDVLYARHANAISVAEYVLLAILSCSRELYAAHSSVRQGEWDRRLYTGRELYGKTLGLVGVGEIGHRIARRAAALGMNIVGYDPFVFDYDFPSAETGIQLTSFDHLLACADFISIHVPLLTSTKGLFSAKEFSKMKSSTYLINTSRGGIINEADLAQALARGELAGAVLDVLEQEPPPSNHPLLKSKKVWLTPHIAGLTLESQMRTSILIAQEVINVLRNEDSLCKVKREKH